MHQKYDRQQELHVLLIKIIPTMAERHTPTMVLIQRTPYNTMTTKEPCRPTVEYICDIFGVNHIWLQSDAAFVYPRLD